jgi:uncharacterized protein YndB with AHSA1/START domain
MTPANTTQTAENPGISTDREIVATRVFDAPRDLVFQMWTDPKHISNWYGPRGFTTITHEMDVRPGGVWRHVMRGPDGTEYPNEIVYVEVVQPERLVYDHASPPRFQTTVTFVDQGGKTKVTAHMVFESAALRNKVATEHRAVEGLYQTLERLGEELHRMSETAEQFQITRVFDAPRDLVWQVFTQPEHLMHWWGPKGFTMVTCKVDLRPGGVFHYCMRAPNGQDGWGKWIYREIAAPERLVTVVSFTDAEGNLLRHPMSPTWPLEMLHTMILTERDGKTTLTAYAVPTNATEEERKTFRAAYGSREQGFTGTLDQLEAYLATKKPTLTLTTPSEREIVLTRVFDAPRSIVFDAMTKPEHLVRWFGPHGWKLSVCEVDLRPGGAWRWVLTRPGAKDMGMSGVYQEVAPPERLVSSESFDDYPGESLNTLTFVEQDGKTTYTNRILYSSPEIRDAVIKSGMEMGARETFDRLAGHLASLKGEHQS